MEDLLTKLNTLCKNTLMETLGIVYTKAEEGFVRATMPVDSHTVQPFGILHGGASMALAESVGSAGSILLIDQEKYTAVGVEINGNHLASVRKGLVTATATLLHRGERTHVWSISIEDEQGRKVMVGRITNMIIEKGKK
ncbi:MAG TPA: hotdog fold thioesterase [Williamwhitmania sp.]|jgi:uncharacterized protein (TIGR00369 family)|nr:hotdog fold thioesterase [Williamwhitmania sp.]